MRSSKGFIGEKIYHVNGVGKNTGVNQYFKTHLNFPFLIHIFVRDFTERNLHMYATIMQTTSVYPVS